MPVNAVDAVVDAAVDNVLDVVADSVLDVAVDNVLDVAVDSVSDVVADSVSDNVLDVVLTASIAGAVVLEEVSSSLAQKGDYLRRDCPCMLQGPSL
jgi:hypothetical protein